MSHVSVQNKNQKPFDLFFNEFFNSFPGNYSDKGRSFPAVNIHETPEAYHLELNAPGRNKEDFQIKIENGQLVVSFEKKQEATQENYKTIRREFTYNSFKRSFYLDDSITTDGIQAKYEQGVLKLLLPKKQPIAQQVTQINVQ